MIREHKTIFSESFLCATVSAETQRRMSQVEIILREILVSVGRSETKTESDIMVSFNGLPAKFRDIPDIAGTLLGLGVVSSKTECSYRIISDTGRMISVPVLDFCFYSGSGTNCFAQLLMKFDGNGLFYGVVFLEVKALVK